jgi:hypothetical protein
MILGVVKNPGPEDQVFNVRINKFEPRPPLPGVFAIADKFVFISF